MSATNEIKTAAEFQQMVGQVPITVVASFRGDWCPFCRNYLSELNEVLNELPEGERKMCRCGCVRVMRLALS